MNRTVSKIKRIGKSPVYLISVISFTIAVAFSVADSITLSKDLAFLTNLAVGDLKMISQESFKVYLDKAVAVVPWAFWAMLLMLAVTAIGMWMHFFENHSSAGVSAKGMGLIKVVTVIEAVLVIAAMCAALLMAGFLLALMIFGGETVTPSSQHVWIIVVAGMVGLIAAIVFSGMYYGGILKTMKSVRMTVNTGIIMGKVSVFVIVMNYAVAAILVFAAIISPSIFSMVAAAAFALSFVMSSIAMSTLRSEMLYIASRGSSTIE